jgi:hypothetical protein
VAVAVATEAIEAVVVAAAAENVAAAIAVSSSNSPEYVSGFTQICLG